MHDRITRVATLAAVLSAAAPLAAQAPDTAPAARAAASPAPDRFRDAPDAWERAPEAPLAAPVDDGGAAPFAPADHWSRGALRRLAAAGLIPSGAALAAWPLRRSRVRGLLVRAARAAERRGDSNPRALARRYIARFDDDFPRTAPDRRLAWRARVGSGWSARRGALRAGAMYWVDGVGWAYPGPRRVPDRSAARLDGTLDLALRPALAASARLHRADGDGRVDAGYVSVAGSGFDIWAGRRGLSLGSAARGGLVLSEGTAFDGVGAAVPGGVRLPGFLDALGPVRGTALLARMQRSGGYEHPWFWAARATFSPHPSLVVGLNRAALFGGAGNEPITARRVLLMGVGLTDVAGKDSDFENQVASVDFFWRSAALGPPLAFYGEWAFDDMGFAWTHVPGIVLGAELAAVPRIPALSLGVEHVWLDRSCCGNPPWYRHGALAEGWTDRGAPLGHPLGGHGRQTAIVWRLDGPGEHLMAGGRLFTRRRGVENLFAPDREGPSAGANARLVARGPGPLRLRATGEMERGDGWRRWSATGALELVF